MAGYVALFYKICHNCVMTHDKFENEIKKIEKLGKRNIKRQIAFIPVKIALIYFCLVVVFCTMFFVGTILVVERNLGFLPIPILFNPLTLGLTIRLTLETENDKTKFYKYKKMFLQKLQLIIEKIDRKPIVFFSDECFGSFDKNQAEEVVLILIANKQLENKEIIGNLLVADKNLNLTIEDAKKYIKTPKRINKKVIMEFKDMGENAKCTNCGHPFFEEDTFCGYCGTLRKDVRGRI